MEELKYLVHTLGTFRLSTAFSGDNFGNESLSLSLSLDIAAEGIDPRLGLSKMDTCTRTGSEMVHNIWSGCIETEQ